MTLFVGIYHQARLGDTAVNVYASRELAERARQQIAIDNWTSLMATELPADPAMASEMYFAQMAESHGDYFAIDEAEVIGMVADRQVVEFAGLLIAAADIAAAFPEIGTEQSLNGADAIDRLNALLPRLRRAIAQAQGGR